MAKRKHPTLARETAFDEIDAIATGAAPASSVRQLSLPLADTTTPPEGADVITATAAELPADAAVVPRLASVAALTTRRASSARATHAGGSTDSTEVAGHAAEPRPARRSRPRPQVIGVTPTGETHPKQPRSGARPCFRDLRVALEEGWEIVQPIFARPLWSVADNSATAFSFVLRRERATRLVTVPEGRTVQRFIRDHHLTVDYRQ
jgi:hypothetical protein